MALPVEGEREGAESRSSKPACACLDSPKKLRLWRGCSLQGTQSGAGGVILYGDIIAGQTPPKPIMDSTPPSCVLSVPAGLI